MNFILRLLTTLVNVLYLLAFPIIWLTSKRSKKQKVSKLTQPLLMISATDLARKIRQKQITSEEICKLYIERIKEVNPIINAVVEDRFESALEEARKVDAFLQTFRGNYDDLEQQQPLLGVPLTTKESCSLAGSSFCCGTLNRIGIKAETDGETVSKLRSHGAIPLLVSNTPEICLSWESKNFVTGFTKNPYDTTRTSAGSSGGEGALLGSGASLIGVGSDIAGSIRLPAMFNGVFGHKPTAGIISVKGHYPYSTDENYVNCFAIGPMVRYAEDLKLMTKLMVNNKAMLPLLQLDKKVDLAKLRVYYMTEDGSFVSPKVDKEIKLKIIKSVEHLKLKCQTRIIDESPFKLLAESCEIGGSVLYSLKGIPNLLKGENQSLGIEIIKSLIGISKYTFNLLLFYIFNIIYNQFVINANYLQKNEELKQLFIKKLGNDGVFLYPTFPSSAFRHNTIFFQIPGVSYLMIFNTLGLPSTHVPCGFDNDGLPIGFQVVAGPNQDRLCFAVAEELEKKFGGWISPS